MQRSTDHDGFGMYQAAGAQVNLEDDIPAARSFAASPEISWWFEVQAEKAWKCTEMKRKQDQHRYTHRIHVCYIW